MKYIIRLNPRAFNPLTHKLNVSRQWEVEQVASRDSERVIWHCRDVRVDQTPIRELFKLPTVGSPPWDMTCFGVCVRGADDALEIKTSKADASGN